MNTMSRLDSESFLKGIQLRHTALLAEAIRSAEALGEAVETLATQSSPQVARSVQATENLVRSVSAEFGMLTGTEVGERIGSSSKSSPRNLASARHRAGELLAIRRGNRLKFPGFQFAADGSPLPIIGVLRRLSEHHDWSESDLFLWLVTPTGRLDDVRPVDALRLESADAQDKVVRAAELEMSTEW